MKKITKLMLTLALLLVGVTGANAQTETRIAVKDYSQDPTMGWAGTMPDGASRSVSDGCLVIVNNSDEGNNWDLQMHIADGFDLHEGCTYRVVITYKSTVNGEVTAALGNWDKRFDKYNTPISKSNDFQTLTLSFSDPLSEDIAGSFVMWQCRSVVGTIYIKTVEVYETVTTPPVDPVWTTILDNDPRCFRSKEYPDGNALPVKINDNGEFVVNAPAKVSDTWDSQFWIRLPQTLAAGKKFKLSFDYRASAAATVGTQYHNEPGQYVWWHCINDIDFTTEWKGFSQTVSVPKECGDNAFRSIAFNLSQTDAVDFYFKNIKIEIDENDKAEEFDFADVYTVAGTTDLCGVEWDTRSNVMTLNKETGKYEKTFENITVSGTAKPKFKVIKNCSWDDAWPNDDWEINTNVTKAEGNFDITITFDPTNKEIGVICQDHLYTATFTTNLGWEHVYAYAWTGNDYKPLGSWSGEDRTEIFDTDGDDVYELSFKAESAPANIIFHNGNGQQTSDLAFVDGKAYTWDLNYYVMSADFFGSWDASEAGKMTKNTDGTYTLSMEGKELSSNQAYKVMKDLGGQTTWYPENQVNNNVIGINMAGTYDIAITIDPANNNTITETMSIYKPITAAGYATFCAPYDLNFVGTGVQAYFAKYQDGRVNFYEIFNAPKNTGLLLKADKGTYKLKMESVTDGAADVTGNKLIGVNEETLVDHSGIYVLMNENGKVGFYQTTAPSFTVGAHTAYIDAIPGNNARFISLDDETTSIDVRSKMEDVRGDVYNLNGQRVAQPTKGLYIINGKKVIVK